MTSTSDTGFRSPWITFWFSPRQTIERIVASRPRHVVWVLAILGSIAGLYAELVHFGAAGLIGDRRFWFSFVPVSAVAGLVLLYLAALVLNWIGRLLGGNAPPLALRAVLAWSALPNILGFIVVLIVSAAWGAVEATQEVLVLLVSSFALWSAAAFMLMMARVQHFGFWRTIAALLLYVVVSFFCAIFIRTVLFQPFNTPAASMMPTLVIGDYFFVNKFAYGYSRYSLPFSPRLMSGRVLFSEPRRGDVVVFRIPSDGAIDYVKRVIGLPGDRIQMKEGLLYINDAPVQRERLEDYVAADACGSEATMMTRRWRETLPNGASYETLDCVDDGFYDDTGLYTVPPGHFFAMGDNRDNSTDSRVLSSVGYIPFENLIGRASIIFFSRAATGNGAAPTVRNERLGTWVR